jgi:hypothetical protein
LDVVREEVGGNLLALGEILFFGDRLHLLDWLVREEEAVWKDNGKGKKN